MRLESTSSPTPTPSADATGLPQIPRGSLAFTRPNVTFSRAMNLAQQMQPGGVWVPLQRQTTQVSANSITQLPNSGTTLTPESSVTPWTANVRSGQTLSGIIREQMASKGVSVSSSDALRLSQQVARSNNMNNPNLIYPGQKINLESLNLTLNQALASQQAITAAAQMEQQSAVSSGSDQANKSVGNTQLQLQSRSDNGSYPVLEKTLDRAVNKGFITSQEKQAVYNKIVQLSVQHRFSPDDFARLTLMESDGMNPKATNSRCHGIIQFCDGADRGAASVGFASNPKAILGHSVLQQLDMVDKYFDETGLKNFGPAGLDDLYLTVLTPAARSETRPNAVLNIPGQQAAYLHVNRDTSAPITRNSILAGLHFNANERLKDGAMASVASRKRNVLASSANSAQALKGMSAYAAQAADDSSTTR